jgi:HAD superfamily hydrolase (TIGR01509 family)
MLSLLACLLLLALSGVYSFSTKSLQHRTSRVMNMLIENFDALLFDCDGVLAETERDVHRVTFNQAFKQKSINTDWDVELYGRLLSQGGGKERMTSYFNEVGWPSSIGSSEEERAAAIKDLHLLKTSLFQSAVESGACSARPGVVRLMDEAFKNNLKVAICSTSNEAAVTTIARTLLGEERLAKIQIFAGDCVKAKKPSPDVYLLAAKTLEVDPSRCWVVEDSGIGLKAAKSAGMKCIVTKSIYTRDEPFVNADIIVEDLERGLDGVISTNYLDYKASKNAYTPPKATENADMFGVSSEEKVVKMFSKIAKGEMGKGLPF